MPPASRPERLRISAFTMIELMIVVAIIGLLASVAIPAFARYIRRAKTNEAIVNLKRMYDSAVAYYNTEHATSSGELLAKDMPAEVVTPGPFCCLFPGGKCPPGAFAPYWTHPSWQA